LELLDGGLDMSVSNGNNRVLEVMISDLKK